MRTETWNIIKCLSPGTVIVAKKTTFMAVATTIRGVPDHFVDLLTGELFRALTGKVGGDESIQVFPTLWDMTRQVRTDRKVRKSLKALAPRLGPRRVTRKRSSKPQWGLSNEILSTVIKNPGSSSAQVMSLMNSNGFKFNTSNPLGSITGLLRVMIDKKLLTREKLGTRNIYHYTAR